MFTTKQNREISAAVQQILRETKHLELPDGEIEFHLHVDGEKSWSWADILNNEAIDDAEENEKQDLCSRNLNQEEK